MMKLCNSLLLMTLLTVPAAVAGTVQLDFSELGTASPVDVNGLSIDGVTFHFAGGSAQYNAVIGLSGMTALVSEPLLVGDTTGTLTLDFLDPTPFLDFDIVMASADPISGAYTVTLAGNSPLSEDTAPIVAFSEGAFSYNGPPITSAVITFSSDAPQFGLDNLTFDPAPEPGTGTLFGGLLVAFAIFGKSFAGKYRCLHAEAQK